MRDVRELMSMRRTIAALVAFFGIMAASFFLTIWMGNQGIHGWWPHALNGGVSTVIAMFAAMCIADGGES